jgi:tetratricopeptide (TPR) repeat protein
VVKILEAAGREPPLGLLRQAGEAWVTIGDVEAARAAFGQALDRIKGLEEKGNAVDLGEHGALALAQARLLVQSGESGVALPFFELAQRLAIKRDSERDAVVVMGDIARLKARKGEIEEALCLHQEQLEVYERLRGVRARAITLGDIARLKAGKGEVEEALRLHQEQLVLFERLGDVRERATTLGGIARLKAAKGEVEEALRLQTERLETNRRLGDLDDQAGTLWDIAQIELGRGDVAKAAPLIAEAYAIVDQIGRLEGICTIGAIFGQILIAAGQREGGLAVLHRSEEGFRRMGRTAEAEQIAALIRQFGPV